MKPLARTAKLADVIRTINTMQEAQHHMLGRLESLEGMMLDLNNTIVALLLEQGMEVEKVELDS